MSNAYQPKPLELIAESRPWAWFKSYEDALRSDGRWRRVNMPKEDRELLSLAQRFPKDPTLKEKWIEACGRKDEWFPTQHGVICSSHFEEKCFQPIAKSRRLFPAALPTLKLRLVFETSSKPTKHKLNTKKVIIKPGDKRSIVEKYKVQIEKYKKGLHQHKMHIKRLQTMVRRYRQKADNMKNILTALKNENAIAEEHRWLLESDGISST